MTAALHTPDFDVAVPLGWDVRITGATTGPAGTVDYPVVHAANFALPGRREDFGGELMAAMLARQVFVALLGYGNQGAGEGLFASAGLPRPLQPDWFDPYQMQRPISGLAGIQRFFTEYGRTFCLYAVVGSYARRAALVPLVNQFLAGVTIQPMTPAAQPASPAAAATNPAGAPTTPAGGPTNPASAATNPAGAPTNPAGAPTTPAAIGGGAAIAAASAASAAADPSTP